MKNAVVIISLILLSSAFSWAKLPACMDKKDRLEINSNQVLTWREFMEPKFTARAFIKGRIVRIMEDRQKHVHFEVDLDQDFSSTDDRIEVIYNTKFGPVPENQPGDEIFACGDFVADPYSPHKAVIHWLHMSPKLSAHEHGYLIINGQITGQIDTKAEKTE